MTAEEATSSSIADRTILRHRLLARHRRSAKTIEMSAAVRVPRGARCRRSMASVRAVAVWWWKGRMTKAGMKNRPMAVRAEARKISQEKALRTENGRMSRSATKRAMSIVSNLQGKKMPRPRGRGWDQMRVNLLWREVLVVAQVHHVLEHGRAWRQVRRVQELDVKRVTTSRRAVDSGAALEDAGVVFRVVHADQRSVVIQGLAAPVFEITEEVVQSAVGAEVLTDAGKRRNGKWNIFASGDGRAVVGRTRVAVAEGSRVVQAVGIGPAVGKQSYRVGDNGCGRVRSSAGPATPEGIRQRTVVVALDVNRVFGGDRESALAIVPAQRQVAGARGVHASVHEFENVARARDGVAQAGCVASGREVRVGRHRVGVDAKAEADVLAAPVVQVSVLVDVFG